jgi:DNA-3-methyladenine glycosylase II
VYGDADEEAVARQVARILSLDVDGRGWPAVGARDPVVGRLQARYRGLRPVTFWSSYEAAAWAVLSHRIRITQAAVLKRRLAERAGTVVDVHGDQVLVFPAPARLLTFVEAAPQVAGLTARKADHLTGIAVAALDGRLDSAALRAQPRAAALAALQELPGIGPFSADLVLLRGAGDPDAFPHTERRLHAAMADLYGLADPGADELAAVAEGWRPYRTWASLLLRVWREDTTGEIGGRPARIRQTGDRD